MLRRSIFRKPKLQIPKINKLKSKINNRTWVGLGLIALLLPIAIITLYKPSQPEASWFDGGYGYRKRVPIVNSSGSEQTDFTHELNLDTAALISAGKMQDDCDDIRITAQNGEVLPYWLEPNTCNTATTKVFVKIPKIPTSGANIYWYYGNPSANSASQSDQAFLKEIDGAVANWPLDDTDPTQSYARVINPHVEEGRNIVINGGFDSDSGWTKGTGWTISGGTAMADGTGSSANLAQQIPLVIGKTYSVTYTISDFTSGSVRVRAGVSGNGTTRNANGTYTETIIAAGDTTLYFVSFNFAGSVDNVSVIQVNIPSSQTTNTNLLVDGDMEVSGTGSWVAQNNSIITKQTTTPQSGSQTIRIAYNGTAQPRALQIIASLSSGVPYRVTGYARGDGTTTPSIVNGGTIWTGSTSTSWQAFDFVYVSSGNTTFALQNSTSSGYVEFDDVTVTEDTTIRPGELLQDGDMEASGTGTWQASASNLTKETTSPHGGSQVLRVTNTGLFGYAYTNPFVTGKTYRATGWVRGDGSGTLPVFYAASTNLFTGTTDNSWQYFDKTFVATGVPLRLYASTTTSGGYAEFDDISVTEVSPLVGKPTNGVTIGSDSNGHLSKAYSFDGVNDYVNIYSSDINSTFNPDEGTLVAWAKVSSASDWTDGSQRRIMRLGYADVSNYLELYKSANNTLAGAYVAGGTNKSVTVSSSSTDWQMITMSWSKSADEVKLYLNGTQTGSTQTSIGTWTGNFASSNSVIGITNTSNLFPWKGLINDVRLYDRALSPEEISAMYSASSDIETYATDNYPGKELVRKFNLQVTTGTLASEETTPGPIAHWSFDEGQGQTVTDNTTNGNDGTLGANSSSGSDDPTWITEDQCVSGKCLRFDGSDHATIGSINVGSTYTYSLWFKTGSSGDGKLISTGTNTHPLQIINGNLRICFENCAVGSKLINDNKWHHAVVTVTNGANARAYLDGEIEISTSSGISINAAHTIGKASGSNTYHFTGTIDEVIIYPYRRTADQIKADYNQGAAVLGISDQSTLSNGLVGYWKMDEASWNGTAGEVKDASGNGNHGVRVGDATTGAGKFGNGGTFDGNGEERVELTSFSDNFFKDKSYTISAWAKRLDTRLSHSLFSYRNDPYSPVNLAMRSSSIRFSGFNSLNQTEFQLEAGTTSIGVWHHIVGVLDYERKIAYLYLDGLLVNSQSCGVCNVDTTNAKMSLGQDYWNGSLFGNIDEARIYNRALSPAEVQALYNFAPGPVGHWKFDEGDGTTTYDSSGNGNNGTLTGATYTVGKHGKALYLDGVSNQATINDSLFLKPKHLTVETWIKPSKNLNTISTNFALVLDKYTIGGGGYRLIYQKNIDTLFASIFNNGTAYEAKFTAASAKLGTTWQYLALTYDERHVKLYVNGDLIQAVEANTTVSYGNETMFIGSYDGNQYFFPGSIDDIKIYNYARTPEQMLQDMQGDGHASGSKLPTPIAHYRFDEPGQSVINHGTGGDSLNGTLGANSSASTDDPTWKTKADCKVNGCLSFDGGDFVLLNSTSAIGNSENFSISSWIKPSTVSGGQHFIYGEFAVNDDDSRNQFSIYGATQKFIFDQFPPASGWIETPNLLVSETWYHVLYTQKGANRKLFINGSVVASDLSAETYTGANPVSAYIGARLFFGAITQTYQGLLDELKIYNVALTEEQVKQDYNAGSAMVFGSTSNEASLLSDGAGAPPVAYWDFNERTGSSANDKSGNGNTGTITGATYAAGKYGSALLFSGSDEVSIANIDTTTYTGLSLSFWLNTTYLGSSATPLYLGGGLYFCKIGGAANKINCTVTGSSVDSAFSTTNINDGRWHFVEYTSTLGQQELYIDGNLEARTSQTFTTENSYIKIGNNGYIGSIDEVKIYNYARTPAQVAYDYNRGAPVAWYRFDECEGNTILDSSGNKNHGTLNVSSGGGQTTAGTCKTSGTAWGNGASGKFNSSVNFDGVDDYVSISSNPSLNITSDITLSSWVRTTRTTSQRIIGGYNPSGFAGYGLATGVQGPGRVGFWNGSVWTSGDTSINDGNWHHVLVSLKSGTLSMYIDGKLDKTITGVSAPSSYNGNRAIGAVSDATLPFNGQIDDVRIYNYALSADQVKQVYNGGAVKFGN